MLARVCVRCACMFISVQIFCIVLHAAHKQASIRLETAVGKSCLLLRFCDDEFTPSFIATIGLDHKSKVVRIDDATAGGKNTAARTVKIQVWDTAGQEQYKTMTSNFYRSAMGVAIVYDVTYRRSFENVTNWLKNVAEHASEHIVKVLVGNKCDAEGARVVSYAEGQSLAAMHGLSFVETSAKANINVDRLFVELAK